MSDTLTKDSAFAARFVAWMNERFPFEHGILFFVLYATALICGILSVDGRPEVGLRELLGFLPAWCFFFMLRVFDEHKDYESDLQNYPERVLQSGLITLGHLKVAGGIAIAMQLAGSLALDEGFGPITAWWLVVMGYSALMGKEFFVGEWLGKRLVLYAVSHMVVMPISLVWMAQIGAGSTPVGPSIAMLAGLSFLSGAAFEVTRKMRGPEEERESVDSYTKLLGTSGAPLVVLTLLLGSAGVQVALLHWIFDGAAPVFWYVLLAAGLVLPIFTLFKFRSAPSAKARKMNEGSVSLAMLLSYVIVVAAIITEYGLTWA